MVAAIYMIPLDRYNKNYDMFNLGNFGGGSTDGIIDDLKNKGDVSLLVRKIGIPKNWQHPNAVTSYVMKNYDKVGEINMFDIYENKKGE